MAQSEADNRSRQMQKFDYAPMRGWRKQDGFSQIEAGPGVQKQARALRADFILDCDFQSIPAGRCWRGLLRLEQEHRFRRYRPPVAGGVVALDVCNGHRLQCAPGRPHSPNAKANVATCAAPASSREIAAAGAAQGKRLLHRPRAASTSKLAPILMIDIRRPKTQ